VCLQRECFAWFAFSFNDYLRSESGPQCSLNSLPHALPAGGIWYFRWGLFDLTQITPYRIGDWYPERNIFQILIALNSGESLVIPVLSPGGLTTQHSHRPPLRGHWF